MAEDQDGKQSLEVSQSMIDIFADRLIGLRTQCSTSNELTRREIRTLEGKLIVLFSQQLITVRSTIREKCGSIPSPLENIPRLSQWLKVVGLCYNCIHNTCGKVKSVEALLEKPQCKLKSFLSNCSQKKEEELRRISTALDNMRVCIDMLTKTENEISNNAIDTSHLHWDSWNWQILPDSSLPPSYPSVRQDCPTINFNGITSTNPDQGGAINVNFGGLSGTASVLSPPPTPVHKIKQSDHVQRSPGSVSDNFRYNCHNKCVDDGVASITQPISKSRSHESQLYKLSSTTNIKGTGNIDSTFTGESNAETVRSSRRTRLPTVPGSEYPPPLTYLYSSPTLSPPLPGALSGSTNNSMLTVVPDSSPIRNLDLNSTFDSPTNGGSIPPLPRSPRTPTSTSRMMVHDIAHRFTKHFSINKPCDYCCKLIIMNTGLKCKECRYRCHKDCESKVPPSCGLPIEFLEEFKRQLTPDSTNQSTTVVSSNGADGSPLPNHIGFDTNTTNASPALNGFFTTVEWRGTGSDTASSNSHSSAPSSPALFFPTQPTPATASAVLNKKKQFDFSPEAINNESEQTSSQLDNVVSPSDTSEEPIYNKDVNREDSQDSQNSENDIDKVWPRQYSVSMKEWEISWDELKMGDILGAGHFGTVYSGNWHGDVAIKVLNMDYMGDEKMLESFKFEVSTFRKTRHDNLVLFMGACMKPPRLAIVTSLVHGITLYRYIHLRRDKFSMGKNTLIAQQISQGMGYLHAKGIVHKDLRTKNIFLEKERVIITDFGLFSVTKLCFKNKSKDGLVIPPGWLCYLAPELMRRLRVHVNPDDEYLPFSKASDVYAFGTVWYELLCGEWPRTMTNPETTIWQVGKGMKPSLANLEASRDVKDILMQCWAYLTNCRPDFTSLLKILDKLPKKKLARSPSHPVHLSRSAESMF